MTFKVRGGIWVRTCTGRRRAMVWILSFIKCALSLIKSGPRGLVLIVFVLEWVRGNLAAIRRLDSSRHCARTYACSVCGADWPEYWLSRP